MQAADQFTQRMNLPRCLNLVHPFGDCGNGQPAQPGPADGPPCAAVCRPARLG